MDSGVKITIIAAITNNWVIGKGGDIPWKLSSDLQRFARLTKGNAIIVGRKTHEAILRRLGHPLKNRTTYIITRQKGYSAPESCHIVQSWDAAIAGIEFSGFDAFVIGGADIYRLAIPVADRMCLTQVHTSCEGDTFFPECNWDKWKIVKSEFHRKSEDDEFDSVFQVLERRSPEEQTFVNLENARYNDQRAVMQRIAQDGICPFCPENRKSGEVLKPVWEGKHWVVVPNRWPYRFTALHLLAIAQRHVRFAGELTMDEWIEFHSLIRWAESAHELKTGTVAMRFGDPRGNGATVDHLHCHIVVADQDVNQPEYERVRFPLGPKPA